MRAPPPCLSRIHAEVRTLPGQIPKKGQNRNQPYGTWA